jgi:hypothetical protein
VPAALPTAAVVDLAVAVTVASAERRDKSMV